MDIVFKAKHWQIFGTFIFLCLFDWVLKDIDPLIGAFSYIVFISITLGWILLLGYGLARRQNKLDSINFKTFMTTGILLIIVDSLAKLLSVTQIIESRTIGVAMMLVLAVYALISLAIIYVYPAKMLKQLETNRDIDINDYFGDIIRLLFFPIGIWAIQPRINKLIDFKVD
jgi:hypothetical protein